MLHNNRTKLIFLLAVYLCLCFTVKSAWSANKGYDNYDGDTLKATFRIANIDAPEIKGACEYEKKLALKAKVFTSAWLAKGSVVIQQTGVDRYGRVLALIRRDSEDLGDALIKAGLARPWKGKREQWCRTTP